MFSVTMNWGDPSLLDINDHFHCKNTVFTKEQIINLQIIYYNHCYLRDMIWLENLDKSI